MKTIGAIQSFEHAITLNRRLQAGKKSLGSSFGSVQDIITPRFFFACEVLLFYYTYLKLSAGAQYSQKFRSTLS